MMRRIPSLVLLLFPTLLNADELRVRDLSQQRVGDTTYFRVSIAEPRDLWMISLRFDDVRQRKILHRLPDMPRLIGLDNKATAVCYFAPKEGDMPTNGTLVFLGRVVGEGEAKFSLLYPVAKETEKRQEEKLLPSIKRVDWVEKPLTLKLRHPEATPPFKRERGNGTGRFDLEGEWAEAQARQFALLELMSEEFGFYGLAREAMGRKYRVPAAALSSDARGRGQPDDSMRLYEMTTGATALAETLATRRLLGRGMSRDEARVHDIASVRGIAIAEHPWEKMMAGKKPAPEPMAKLIPHDHYYVAFQSMRRFLEFGDLMEDWGSALIQGYELKSRDVDLKRRYERQLCLRSTTLGRTLGPALIRGIGVTGSDLFLREGSDVSVLFHVRNSDLFYAAVEQFIVEARKEFGKHLKHDKEKYRDIAVESFVSPLREVSLHRATLGEFVIYANSGVALRRIIDTHKGKRPALSDMLDFRYMRTVFRADDKAEDGFAFLSDAFIRQLVGPASKIKEKRRLEALCSLQLASQAALFHAWETGKLPKDAEQLRESAKLSADEIAMPEGNSIAWDAERKVAVSDVYNTIHFQTPLIELPMEKVTDVERTEYERFRQIYTGQWRNYFDPVGIRVGLQPSETKVEVYLLPLVENSEYNWLRQLAGGGTLKFDPRNISTNTLFQFTMRLSKSTREWFPERSLGDQAFIRIDDGPGLYHWLRYHVNYDRGMAKEFEFSMNAPLLWVPAWVVGVRMGDEKKFDEIIDKLNWVMYQYRDTSFLKATKSVHRGITVHEHKLDRDDWLMLTLNPPGTPPSRRIEPGVFWFKHEGYFYLSLHRPNIVRVIDVCLDRKKLPKAETVEINSGVYLSANGAKQAGEVLRAFFEWETHKRAVSAETLWLPLYRAGLIAADAKPAEAEAAARRFLGFLPSSPDGSKFRYDARLAEVVNVRHGNLRQPKLNETLATTSPLVPLLEQMQWLRADLRFREDGIHTTVTLRKAPKK